MQLLKIMLFSTAVITLSGCTLMNDMKDFFNDNSKEKTVVAPAPKPAATTTSNNKKTDNRQTSNRKTTPTAKPATGTKGNAEDNGIILAEAIISSDAFDEVEVDSPSTSSSALDVSNCRYSATTINDTMESLARLALRSCQPKQPNSTMIRPIAIIGTSCGSNPTDTVYATLSSSGKFALVNSSLANRIENQLHNASNGYMIRVAKSQNINYIISGSVNTQSGVANLKIVDVSKGSVLWQNSANLK